MWFSVTAFDRDVFTATNKSHVSETQLQSYVDNFSSYVIIECSYQVIGFAGIDLLRCIHLYDFSVKWELQ